MQNFLSEGRSQSLRQSSQGLGQPQRPLCPKGAGSETRCFHSNAGAAPEGLNAFGHVTCSLCASVCPSGGRGSW